MDSKSTIDSATTGVDLTGEEVVVADSGVISAGVEMATGEVSGAGEEEVEVTEETSEEAEVDVEEDLITESHGAETGMTEVGVMVLGNPGVEMANAEVDSEATDRAEDSTRTSLSEVMRSHKIKKSPLTNKLL